jgi:hypothetical protein
MSLFRQRQFYSFNSTPKGQTFITTKTPETLSILVGISCLRSNEPFTVKAGPRQFSHYWSHMGILFFKSYDCVCAPVELVFDVF